MLSNLVIRFVVLFFCNVFVHYSTAQTRSFNIRPGLGMQMPLANNTINDLTKAELVNNKPWLVLGYSIQLEYITKKENSVFISYGNGDAGYSMGVIHNKACNNYNGPYSDRFKASSANEKRLLIGYTKLLSKRTENLKPFAFKTSVSFGLGLDFNSSEDLNGSQIIFPGINRCGEEFVLQNLIFDREAIGLILPIQVNFNSRIYKKKFISLSLFYHIGLTRHYYADVDYVTPSYTEKTRFLIRGSTLGFKLSYPIKLITLNKKD